MMCRFQIACLILSHAIAQHVTDRMPLNGPSEDYFDRGQDGSYKFGYKNLDYGSHFHSAVATRDNTVSGSFGARDPANQRVVQTLYTAGDRGFRAQGPNIARRMDLSQTKIPYRPSILPNSPDHQPSYKSYHDPNEDPSYKFALKTSSHTRDETSDSKGTVNGAYSYLDDIGKRHDVKYEAGSETGFHVKTAFPDSEPYGGLFYRGPNKPGTSPRGHLSIVQGKDGAYQFTATGPDQKRVEVSDSIGRIRGSYTYLDDKGVQRSVQYVAGPNIGYKVIRKGSGPINSPLYPFSNTDFLAPSQLPNDASPDVRTTTSSNNLFGPESDSLSESPGKNMFLDNAADKFTTPTHPQHLHVDTESSNYWNPPHTTSKRPDLDPSLHLDRPTQSSQSSSMSYDDLFGEKSSSYDRDSEIKWKQHLTNERGHNKTKRPPNLYSHPKPDKSFGEEPYRSYLGSEEPRRSGVDGNFFRLPPGVVVRAHVQSLDILPYGSKVPPPEETFQRHLFEELHHGR